MSSRFQNVKNSRFLEIFRRSTKINAVCSTVVLVSTSHADFYFIIYFITAAGFVSINTLAEQIIKY